MIPVGARRAAFRVWRRLSPPRLLAGSFLLLIGVGTLGLRFLPGLQAGEALGWLDALFTATSAVCVTGLIVVDTATHFTPLGQLYLLVLIQLGGLGMITLASLMIVALGRRLSLRQEALGFAGGAVTPVIEPRRLVRHVVVFTFAVEAAGATALYALWVPRLGWDGAAWPAVFHAISAFCNAGFSTFPDSLIGFGAAPFTLAVVMALIVIGGLGFLSLEELWLHRRARRARRPFRLSLHTRLVLVTTAVLIAGGALAFSLAEWDGVFAALPTWARPLNGLFMSVTARTAGFNAIEYGEASVGSNFLTILLMSIGGSPGSTAGGLKTTTIALIGLLAWSRFRGLRHASLWGRSVPDETVQRAVGLFVFAFGVVTLAILLLGMTDVGLTAPPAGGAFLAHMFEAVSAFNTVGLSMGATGELSPAGRWIAIVLMFVGRVGPLTFAAAVALRADAAPEFRYAREDVIIG